MKFPSINPYVTENEKLFLADINSRAAVHIPDIISEYGGGFFSALKTRLPILRAMMNSLRQARISARSIRANPKSGKTTITDIELSKLETYMKNLGINQIGYAKVDRNMIFQDMGILYENTIVLILEMKKEAIDTAPSKTAIKEIFRTYNELGIIANQVSAYMRDNGFDVMAGPAIGGAVNYVPLAQKAGLGIIGKHGVLITDNEYGPSLRIAAIYVNIENLPLLEKNPHDWVKDFCDSCNKCVRTCPTGAIYKESIAVNDNPKTRRCIDNTKCAIPFAKNYGCTLCIKNCTFYAGDYNTIKAKFLHQNQTSS